jgi:3-methyladenine DNA glycosylase Tag
VAADGRPKGRGLQAGCARAPEARDLKRRGFRFVGPTVIYAFMQAVGMVDDHTVDCFRRADVT